MTVVKADSAMHGSAYYHARFIEQSEIRDIPDHAIFRGTGVNTGLV